jgi:superfamily II DNA/RNA helicase
VETTYGRIGAKGWAIVIVVDDEDEAIKHVQKSLKRRQSTPNRIGVGYEERTSLGLD